jgi:hypothetical protein
LDHLVFVASDLDDGVRRIEELFGVEMSPGGQHHGFGTCNRLLGLGPDAYMEVIAIDPEQPDPAGPRWFGLDDVVEMRLATWCAKSSDLETLIARGRDAGIDLGEPSGGGRERPDGSRLNWTVSDPWAARAGGVVPFFIDWGATEHPAGRLPGPCAFKRLRVEHPEVTAVTAWLGALGLDVAVSEGDTPRVIALIDTPRGEVELR